MVRVFQVAVVLVWGWGVCGWVQSSANYCKVVQKVVKRLETGLLIAGRGGPSAELCLLVHGRSLAWGGEEVFLAKCNCYYEKGIGSE